MKGSELVRVLERDGRFSILFALSTVDSARWSFADGSAGGSVGDSDGGSTAGGTSVALSAMESVRIASPGESVGDRWSL